MSHHMATRSDNGDAYHRKLVFHDREFQEYSFRREVYLAPIDLEEETRLRDQHDMLKMIYHDWTNALHPDFIVDPEAVLDCGFGTGSWMYDVAEYDPDCSVIGVDICPLMAPPDQLQNMDLQIADLNERLDFADPGTFDLIHSRFVGNGIAAAHWPNYIRDMYRLLRRGGWAQVTEWEFNFRSDAGDSDALQSLREWTRVYLMAIGTSARPAGRKSVRTTQDCESWMRMAGFTNVQTDVRDVPTNAWPEDAHARGIGELNLTNMSDLLYSLALYPVVQRQIMSDSDFRVLVDAAVVELGNVGAKPYIRLCSCFGQKT